MSKNYIICLAFIAGMMAQVSSTHGQTVGLEVGSATIGCTGSQTITVPVSMSNGSNITACQFTLQWDPTLLDFVPGSGTLQGIFATPLISPNFGESQISSGKLTFAWIDNPGVTTGTGAVTMFTIQFNILSPASSSIDIVGSPTPIKVGKGGPPPVNQSVQVTHGNISTGDTDPPILVCPADQTLTSDSPILVNTLFAYAADDCVLKSLDYVLSGATTGAGSGDASGQDLFNPGVTFLQYTATDGAGNTESCISTITINPDTLTVIAQSREGECNDPLYIDILVDNFDDVSTLGFTLNWNPAIIQFDSAGLYEDNFIGVQATDLGFFQVANGKLTFAWYDAANHSAPDQTRLFRIYFKAIGGYSTASSLTFSSSPTPQLAGTGAPTPTQIPAKWQDGTATIIDLTPPTITCPNDTIVQQIASFPYSIAGLNPVVADNCGVAGVDFELTSATTGSGPMPGNGQFSFNEGVTTVNLTVTDVAGNQSSCQFTATLTGQAKPNFILPTLSVECGTTDTVIELTVLDFKNVNSADLVVGFNPAVISVISVGDFHPATGGSGNWFSTVNGGQILLGFANTPNNTGVTLIDGAVLLKIHVKITGLAGATSQLTFDQQPSASSPGGPYPTVGQDGFLSVVDTKPPVLSGCPFDFQILAGSTCQAIAAWLPPTATDDCDGSNVVLTSDIHVGDTLGIGSHVVHYTVVDQSNHAAACQFTIDVIDATGPVITCPGNDTLAFDAGLCSVTIDSLGELPKYLSVSDNCTANPFVIEPNITFPQTLAAGEQLDVLWTAVDDAGNATYCNFIVSTQVAAPPTVVSCPGNTTVECDAVASFDVPLPVFDKGCSASLGYTVSDTTSFPNGTTTVLFKAFTAMDTVQCAFTVTVKDTKKPLITKCPANDTLLTSAGCTVTMPAYQVDIQDNCDQIVDVTFTPAPGVDLPVGDTTVVVVATDDAGNSDTCQFKITVKPTQTATYLNCPTDITYFDTCHVLATWTVPTPAGFCGPVTVVASDPLGFVNLYAGLPDTISYLATDMAGNSATCVFILTAIDTVKPVLSCPPAITVDVAGTILSDPGQYIISADTVSGCTSVILNFGLPSVNENCSAVNLIPPAVLSSGSPFPLGASQIYWRAEDASGNTGTCLIDVTVVPLDTPNILATPDPACLGSIVDLTTDINLPGQTYEWKGPNQFTSTAATAIIFGLTQATAGPYTVNTFVNGCPAPTSKSFRATLATNPVATDDYYDVLIGQTLDSFNVLTNDQLTSGDSYTVTQLNPVLYGTMDTLSGGLFNYTAPATAVGQVDFMYAVCSVTCPDLCDTAVVFINVKETSDNCAYIPKVITPNGDGVNDWWLIFCLETGNHPDNSVIIFNQWGDKVYEASPYVSSSQLGWRGDLDGDPSKPLPDGTYYYIFKPGPSEETIRGFVTIFR